MAYSKLLHEPLKEHFKNRRVWGSILSAIAAGAISLGYPQVAIVTGLIAGVCSLDSYVRPKLR